ncbi:MAG: MBL fold metallo-hydrolase [Desulfobacterales bacterium]|nr:MBL fold metallo-hydrolase [Desulfobacterales bacterium]
MLINILNLSGNRVIYQYRGKSSNIYIIEEKNLKSTFLIDCGLPSDAKRLSAVLHLLPPLKRIVCTHFHVDHVSGWIKLRKIYPNCEIRLHEAAIPFVLGHQRMLSPTFKDIITVLIPCMREYGYFPTLVDLIETEFYTRPLPKVFCTNRLNFFQNTEPVLPGFETLSTPGHSPDSTSFFDPENGLLIAGDLLIVLNGKLLWNPFVSSPTDQKNSILKIKNTEGIQYICPGHGLCQPFHQLGF